MTLKIDAGKFYRTRDGRKVGPMRIYEVEDETFDVFDDGDHWGLNGLHAEGDPDFGHDPCQDLIAEWTDATAIDLTAITTPFGLLDEATQAALKAHGGPYEAYFYRGWGACEPGFTTSTAYRVATTYTPDDVPWDAVDDRFNWYARDENGDLYFYAKKPGTVAMFKQWEDGGELAPADCLKITIGNAPWDKSLQRRPGK